MKNLKGGLKLTLTGFLFALILSGGLIGAYAFSGYASYLQKHKAVQSKEIADLQQKAASFYAALKKQLALTSKRIQGASDEKAIQRILSGLPYAQGFLEIQKVSYAH